MARTLPQMLLLPAALLALGLLGGCDRPFGAGSGGGTGGPGAMGGDPVTVEFFQTAVGDRVLFAVDRATLDDAARLTLDAQAQWLNTNTGYSAVIEGHADEQGTREYNLALGARRAASVQEYLVSRGVAAHRLSSVTYGKERPLAICSDESCYARNRRAVTVLKGGNAGF